MPSNKTLPGDLLTPEQAAEILALDVTTVYAKLRAGELPFVDLSRRARRIRRSDLEVFIKSRLRGEEAALHREDSSGATPSLADYWSRPSTATGRQTLKGATR